MSRMIMMNLVLSALRQQARMLLLRTRQKTSHAIPLVRLNLPQDLVALALQTNRARSFRLHAFLDCGEAEMQGHRHLSWSYRPFLAALLVLGCRTAFSAGSELVSPTRLLVRLGLLWCVNALPENSVSLCIP